ncbi:gamma-glutamyl-gamma-aminobutyrate hydrolase family protein [Plantibacter sp. VKM Ac-2880]|uniref:anthranilate synthase component II n=1 Tax=Plantibacter sp. VKM Ac-2880 TaxID=2783827 RepID=UPI00188E43CB|nr:gamma-glutamyl-gamma-aminobutyrate hydrolase family protein [Plantibacter sp. VKM Ac-2880]MBF4567302.1 gamma-glutamyl-gamma-aminobutyrate hydrolase family protein [Plantibacter sp. VKM Ac-2880]
MTRILVIDNYDSFVYTLIGYVEQLGAETTMVRNDGIDVGDLEDRIREVDGVLVSPGPGSPSDAGISIAAVLAAHTTGTPLLGVCLGHQAIAEAFGATVGTAEELMHGQTSSIEHDGSMLYDGVPHPFSATRYHSLAVVDGTVPNDLEVTSRTVGGVIMGLRHREAPIHGVQFHPESVLSEGGYRLLANWLETAGLQGARQRAAGLSPLMERNPSTSSGTGVR